MDIDNCLETLRNGKLLSESELYELTFTVRSILSTEPNVIEIQTPVIVCGDIHGQFYDLLHLFEVGGQLPDNQYLFLGDYVDRGIYSIEVISYLLLLKVKYPTRIHILRGNHESRMITQDYGFYEECYEKYNSIDVWNYFMEVFDYLSVAAVIDNQIFCVHGGLSPSIRTIDQIRYTIERNNEIPHTGAFSDLMWSDPEDDMDGMRQSSRGAGYLFGKKPVDEFCELNNLTLIARAHQLVMQGYEYHFDNKLVTVWSAPNYCGRCDNIASIMKVDTKCHEEFTTFDYVDRNMNCPRRNLNSMFQ